MQTFRLRLLCATMLATTVQFAPVAAADEAKETQVAQAQTAPGASTAGDTDERKVEKVTVTARKREERLVNVPQSVSVVTGNQIERDGIDDSRDLIGRTPSLFISQNNTRTPQKDQTFLTLRGIGSNPVLEPSVGVFVDGVYQSSLGFDLDFLGVERVELLRGPQGSLFGRNTEGGALNIITRKPGKDSAGRLVLEGDDLYSGKALVAVSGALSDTFFAGITGQVKTTEGYYDNVTLNDDQDDQTSLGGRIALRWVPSDETEVYLTVDVTSRSGGEVGAGVRQTDIGETFDVKDDIAGDMDEDVFGTALTIEHDFGGVMLTSITGYRDISGEHGFDADGGITDFGFYGFPLTGNVQKLFTDQDTLSQEVRLASTGSGNFSWLIGAYAFRENDHSLVSSRLETLFFPPTATIQVKSDIERSGFALFGQATYTAFDGFLDITGGLRWSTEDVDGNRANNVNIPSFGFVVNVASTNSSSFDNVSPTVQLAAHLSDTTTAYVNVARGYKSGGFDKFPSSTTPYLPIDPETTWNYEVGLKSIFDGGAGFFSGALFHIDIDDMQLPTLVIDPITSLPRLAISNAGKGTSRGFEAEVQWQATDELRLGGNLSYVTTEFENFVAADPPGPGVNQSGKEFPNTPNWLFGLNGEYRAGLDVGMDGFLRASWRYTSDYFSGLGTSGDPRYTYDSRQFTDAEMGVVLNDDLELAVFARNAFDEYAVTNFYNAGVFGDPQGFDKFRQMAPPRTFGVRVRKTW